uniref:Glabrous enhancer-binding protein-like DBD domain-containing protein n=4 Tax=Triticinae TaxID=1648030 RepID=A0A453DTA7_AEGTS
ETLAARMGRKSRQPSPPPPPPPEEESSAEEEEEEAAAEATPATQNSPKPPSAATADDAEADADSSDGSDEESSESGKIDAEAFELRQIASSKLESDAGEPTPPAKDKKKGRSLAEPSPSGTAKKAKAGVAEKALSELTPSSEGKKKRKAQPEKTAPWNKLEKPGHPRRWTTEDEIKILEALVRHVKANGTQPGARELIAAVGGSLERKNVTKTEMYEKVRNIRQRYEKAVSTGALPEKDDDLRKFKLSEQVWGENAKQVAAATMAQNEAASLKGKKKEQTSKEKTEGHSKGGTAKEVTASADETEGYSKGGTAKQATDEKVEEDSKGRSSKKASTADTPAKSRKRGNHKEELEGDAKTGTTKETVDTTTQNGGTLVRSKSGKSDKEKADGDAESPMPKEAMADAKNGGTLALFKKEGKTHEEKMDTDANARGTRKGFEELQKFYPNLTSYVEDIQAQHPCGETLKRAFEFIPDEKACALESKIKRQRVAELRMEMRRSDTKKEVTNIFIGLLD